jgi:hypothetical protein
LPAKVRGKFVDRCSEQGILLPLVHGGTHSFRGGDAVLDPGLRQGSVGGLAQDHRNLDLPFPAGGVPGETRAAQVLGAVVDLLGCGGTLLPELHGSSDPVGCGKAVLDPR